MWGNNNKRIVYKGKDNNVAKKKNHRKKWGLTEVGEICERVKNENNQNELYTCVKSAKEQI